MLTKDQLDSIAKYILQTAPGHDFLVLITPRDNDKAMMVASSLPKPIQPLMAQAFVAGCAGIETGQFSEAPFPQSH